MLPKPLSALPPLETLLVSGGDDRIALNASGVNAYGCSPFPLPQALSFSSSTASSISTNGYAACKTLYAQLEAAFRSEPPAVTYAREMNRIRAELVSLCAMDAHTGLEIIFGVSGTDLHLLAAQLCYEENGLLVIMPDAAETGSGVRHALAGCHFSSLTSQGLPTAAGEKIVPGQQIDVTEIRHRLPNGHMRPPQEAAAEMEALVLHAMAAKRRVLLVLVDSSKTGLILPDPEIILTFKRRYPSAVDVLVDACQFRLSPAALHAYLGQQYMVAMTGSKFIGGPAFSAALMLPQPIAERLRSRHLPQELCLYSTRAEWPEGWEAGTQMTDYTNYGLLLRWEAALSHLRAFHKLPPQHVADVLAAFARAMEQRLRADPAFEPLAACLPDAKNNPPTLFPFLLRHPQSGTHFSHPQMRTLYERMQEMHCYLGQPVIIGIQNETPIGALRLSLDMRLIADAVSGRGSDAVIADAMAALDMAAELVRQTV